MSTSIGTDSTLRGTPSGSGPALEHPTNWRDALVGLVVSRIALIQCESKSASQELLKRLILMVMAGVAALGCWALLVVGGIGALAVATAWPWYWLALAAALLHALAAACFIGLAKTANTPVFPVTRNEFLKDREWLQTLKSTRN